MPQSPPVIDVCRLVEKMFHRATVERSPDTSGADFLHYLPYEFAVLLNVFLKERKEVFRTTRPPTFVAEHEEVSSRPIDVATEGTISSPQVFNDVGVA